MSNEEREKKKVYDFFKGFLITDSGLIIVGIISYISTQRSLREYRTTLAIVLLFCLTALGIIISVIGARIQNKHPYISKGMITAIFGLVSLLIKTNEDQLDDPYKEQPKKKRDHLKIGFLLSIGLVILYSLLISLVFEAFNNTEISWFEPMVLTPLLDVIILSNICFGVIFFFATVKFRYISRGMITAFLIPIFLLCVLSIFAVLFGAHYLMDPIYTIWLFVIGVFLIIVRTRLEKNPEGKEMSDKEREKGGMKDNKTNVNI